MTVDLAGKNFIVTGANTGIGKITAKSLADRGAHVILACRSLAKTQPVLDEIGKNAEFLELDLADLASVRRANASTGADKSSSERIEDPGRGRYQPEGEGSCPGPAPVDLAGRRWLSKRAGRIRHFRYSSCNQSARLECIVG